MTRLDWSKARQPIHDGVRARMDVFDEQHKKKPRRKTAVWKGDYRMMFARFPGTCCICGGPVDSGEAVGHDRNRKRVAHTKCVNAQQRADRPPATCHICGRALTGTDQTVIRRRGANRPVHRLCLEQPP